AGGFTQAVVLVGRLVEHDGNLLVSGLPTQPVVQRDARTVPMVPECVSESVGRGGVLCQIYGAFSAGRSVRTSAEAGAAVVLTRLAWLPVCRVRPSPDWSVAGDAFNWAFMPSAWWRCQTRPHGDTAVSPVVIATRLGPVADDTSSRARGPR